MSQLEPEATPAQQEAVRRLLAEARHDEPMPDDVATRLDGVLAQLAAEGDRAVDPPEPAVVVDLAARRRRRVTRLLGAAAAVVVLGVGVGRLADLGSVETQSDSDSSGAGAASSAEDAPVESEAVSGDDGAAPNTDPQSMPVPSRTDLPATVPRVGSRDFQQTVVRLRDNVAVTSLAAASTYSGPQLTTESLYVCAPTDVGAGRLVPVTYVGSPAVLAYRPPTGDTQVVELLQCGSGEVLRSVVIPAP